MVDFKPGSPDRYGKITDDGCCRVLTPGTYLVTGGGHSFAVNLERLVDCTYKEHCLGNFTTTDTSEIKIQGNLSGEWINRYTFKVIHDLGGTEYLYQWSEPLP